jgi:hypothetical protein
MKKSLGVNLDEMASSADLGGSRPGSLPIIAKEYACRMAGVSPAEAEATPTNCGNSLTARFYQAPAAMPAWPRREAFG